MPLILSLLSYIYVFTLRYNLQFQMTHECELILHILQQVNSTLLSYKLLFNLKTQKSP